jgi:hypothetical protein
LRDNRTHLQQLEGIGADFNHVVDERERCRQGKGSCK